MEELAVETLLSPTAQQEKGSQALLENISLVTYLLLISAFPLQKQYFFSLSKIYRKLLAIFSICFKSVTPCRTLSKVNGIYFLAHRFCFHCNTTGDSKDKNFAAVILWAQLLHFQISCHSLLVVLTRSYLCLY